MKIARLFGSDGARAARAYEALYQAQRAVDPDTARHASQTAWLAVRLGRTLGLPLEALVAVYFGALVHDIGKLWLPRAILHKPGPLTAAERATVQTHPDVGRRVLENVNPRWPVALIAHQHHERLDGSGYPLGSKAGALAPEARVVAVADVVQAMTARRPYRAPLPRGIALYELQAERASGRLDADAVHAASALLERAHVASDGGIELRTVLQPPLLMPRGLDAYASMHRLA